MRSPLQLEYDPSHGHHMVWIVTIVSTEGRRVWPSAFLTLGQAQVFFNPQIEGPSWTKRDDGWVGEIRQRNQATFKGHTILINNVLMMKEEDVIPAGKG